MNDVHANVSLLKKLDICNLAGAADLFAPDFVWHYFNPNLPEVEGNYEGLSGLEAFFETMGKKTGGNFSVRPISVTDFGDELVVTHVRNSMSLKGQSISIDAVVVWRIVDGRIAEAWDIPSAHTLAKSE